MSRTSSAPLPSPLPLVLDTNVVLDLLVFDDPAVRPLRQALSAGTVIAWVDGDTLGELEHVLAYPTFKLDEVAQRETHARYRNLVRVAPEDMGSPVPPLPRCRDRDDQKFLVLAARVGAAWLVSKDKRVLSLADRQGLPFDILTSRRMAERLLQLERDEQPQVDAARRQLISGPLTLNGTAQEDECTLYPTTRSPCSSCNSW